MYLMKPDIPGKNVSNGKERVCGLSSSIPLALTLTLTEREERERETTHLPTLPGRTARLDIFFVIIICRLFVFIYCIYRVEEPRESRVHRIHIIKLNNA